MATWVTSNTTMAAPQLALQLGIWGMLGYSLGSVGLMMFAPLAARIKNLMPAGFTSGDFIRLRYGKLTWRVFLIISLFYAIGWLISLGMAGGILIHALTGIPYQLGSTVILVICVAYTVLGGLRAVIGTDFIQTLLILIGIVILAALVIANVGFERMHDEVLAQQPELLNLLMPAALMFLFNNLLFGVGEIFHSNVWWSRAFAFRHGVGFRAYLTAGIFWLPIPIVAGFVALASPALNLNIPAADMVGPMVAAKVFGVGGAILAARDVLVPPLERSHTSSIDGANEENRRGDQHERRKDESSSSTSHDPSVVARFATSIRRSAYPTRQSLPESRHARCTPGGERPLCRTRPDRGNSCHILDRRLRQRGHDRAVRAHYVCRRLL